MSLTYVTYFPGFWNITGGPKFWQKTTPEISFSAFNKNPDESQNLFDSRRWRRRTQILSKLSGSLTKPWSKRDSKRWRETKTSSNRKGDVTRPPNSITLNKTSGFCMFGKQKTNKICMNRQGTTRCFFRLCGDPVKFFCSWPPDFKMPWEVFKRNPTGQLFFVFYW